MALSIFWDPKSHHKHLKTWMNLLNPAKTSQTCEVLCTFLPSYKHLCYLNSSTRSARKRGALRAAYACAYGGAELWRSTQGCLGPGSAAAHAALCRDGAVQVTAGFAGASAAPPPLPTGRIPGAERAPARQVALWHRFTETALAETPNSHQNRLKIALVTQSFAFAERPDAHRYTQTHPPTHRALPSASHAVFSTFTCRGAEGKVEERRGRLKIQPRRWAMCRSPEGPVCWKARLSAQII